MNIGNIPILPDVLGAVVSNYCRETSRQNNWRLWPFFLWKIRANDSANNFTEKIIRI